MIARAWGAATDAGLVRAVNEDAMLVDPPVFMVADGMGGHQAGDLASRLAVYEFLDLVGRPAIRTVDAATAVARANQAVLAGAEAASTSRGMGTTLVGLVAVTVAGSDHWMVINVGDSRGYRWCDGLLEQLTVDHSEVEEMVAAGEISRDEARRHIRRHVVTRSLGTDPAPVIDSWMFPPLAGERYLLCSDGLTDEVEDGLIGACLSGYRDPREAARALVRSAIEAGGHDNITAVVIDGMAPTGAGTVAA